MANSFIIFLLKAVKDDDLHLLGNRLVLVLAEDLGEDGAAFELF